MTEEVIFKRLPLTNDGKLIKNGWGLKSPRNLTIVKYPKSGSTLSLCNVPKVLILDSERGTEYFKPDNVTNLLDESLSNKFKNVGRYGWLPETIISIIDELRVANKMSEYWKLYYNLENERDLKTKEVLYGKLKDHINMMPFPIIAIDTITSIIKISNEAALYEYNFGVKESSKKEDIKRVDEYGGVQYIRRKFAEIKIFIENNAAPFIQYHGHIGLRKKVLKKGEDEINALDIALEGVLSTIFTAKSDAVCTFQRDDKGCWLDFLKKEETDLGSRVLHLSNKKIKIAEIASEDDLNNKKFPKTFWSLIYPEVTFN